MNLRGLDSIKSMKMSSYTWENKGTANLNMKGCIEEQVIEDLEVECKTRRASHKYITKIQSKYFQDSK